MTDFIAGEQAGEREYKRYVGDMIEIIHYDENEQFVKGERHYQLQDHLGSVDVITDEQGQVVQELSFDAWGQRRDATNWKALGVEDLVEFDTSITNRGFTGHEMVDGVGIIHMNGRIYDPKLARFLQADPYVQHPYDTQGLNRYAYVRNNPLNATDPSGYVIFALAFGFAAQVAGAKIVATAILVGIGATLDAIVSGAPLLDALKSGFIAGLQSFTFANIGQQFRGVSNGNIAKVKTLAGNGEFSAAIDFAHSLHPFGKGVFLTSGQIAAQISLHAVAGGVFNVIQGGEFGHGFASAGLTKAATPINFAINGFNVGEGVSVTEVFASAIVGGTISELTGGKFANGAITAAFQNLFNEQGAIQDNSIQVDEDFVFTEEHARNTLIWLFENRKMGVGGIQLDDIVSYLDSTETFTAEQMTVSLTLATNISNTGEIVELLSDVATSKNLKSILKTLASETTIRAELKENLEENFGGLDFCFICLDKSAAIAAGINTLRGGNRLFLFLDENDPRRPEAF